MVLRADADTVLLDLDGFCLAVLGVGAVQLPCGVRTPVPRLTGSRAGELVRVADGVIQLPRFEVLVTEIVDNTVPVLGAAAAAWGAAHLETVADNALRGLREAVPEQGLSLLRDADPRAVEQLIGTGPPGARLGDDVVAGWLAAAVATRHHALPRVRSATLLAIRESADRLGATLLGCAARGETVPELRSLLVALDAEDEVAAGSALGVLLARRTSGGAGLVLGALQALTGVAGRSPVRQASPQPGDQKAASRSSRPPVRRGVPSAR